jgi:hypothetical protein
MQPRYMGRTMIMYPVSETELENISSLSGQVTFRFSLTTLFLGLAASIWTNAVFYTELTPAGVLAAHFVGPVAIGVGDGVWIRRVLFYLEAKKRMGHHQARIAPSTTALVEVVAAQ